MSSKQLICAIGNVTARPLDGGYKRANTASHAHWAFGFRDTWLAPDGPGAAISGRRRESGTGWNWPRCRPRPARRSQPTLRCAVPADVLSRIGVRGRWRAGLKISAGACGISSNFAVDAHGGAAQHPYVIRYHPSGWLSMQS